MKLFWTSVIFLSLLPAFVSAGEIENCSYKGIPLKGKVEIVKNFADIKVEVVENFADIKVKLVENFADDCGEWEIVEAFGDFKIEIVENFGDIKVEYVKSFPGVKK